MSYNELLVGFGKLIFFFLEQLLQTSWLVHKRLYLRAFLIQLVRVSVQLIFELTYFLQMTCLLLLIVVFDLEATQILIKKSKNVCNIILTSLTASSFFNISSFNSARLIWNSILYNWFAATKIDFPIYHFFILIFNGLETLDRILVLRFQLVQLIFNIQLLLFIFSWMQL